MVDTVGSMGGLDYDVHVMDEAVKTDISVFLQQQQQQQHSLLSQASWGRLEMKPKRDEKQGDT
jgi:hypothetical protein